MQTILRHKLLLLVLFILMIALVGYFAYKSSQTSDNTSGGVTKQDVSQTSDTLSTDPNASGPGEQFVAQLLAIQNINLNLDLFTDPVFLGLQDFSQVILPQPISRPNPFAPINYADLNGINIVPEGASAGTGAQAGLNSGVTQNQNGTTKKTTTGTRTKNTSSAGSSSGSANAGSSNTASDNSGGAVPASGPLFQSVPSSSNQ